MRFFIGFLVTLGLIILIIVLLLSGRGGPKQTQHPLVLGNHVNTTSTASVLIDGVVNADSQHNQVLIEVTEDQVTATIYKGYQQNVLRQKTFANNSNAYGDFLQALQHSGFTLFTPGVTSDERGYCPTGQRYVLKFTDNGDTLRRSWTTSCGTSVRGSYPGPINDITNLFEAQVPNYSDFVGDVDIF